MRPAPALCARCSGAGPVLVQVSVYQRCPFLDSYALLGEPGPGTPATSWVLNRLFEQTRSVSGWAQAAIPGLRPPPALSSSSCSLILQPQTCGAQGTLGSEGLIWPDTRAGTGKAGGSAPTSSPHHTCQRLPLGASTQDGGSAASARTSRSCHPTAGSEVPRGLGVTGPLFLSS